ncbi:hypothetical protein CEY09_30475 [Achromobacter marplatensis]|uniref:HeH/LEM domain-containing protein n=1 Tax=Achromobacter marplatensis TaxID=470868 RepID=A0ABX9FWF4_9BURK|nr:hypothetical protein [Achromobacter marplatensis]OWT55316.1 hypothetical protein CEY09_30475 [Achromobacter marplatensis]RBP10658.1 hypothetical protein DFP87_12521 [Achromobacter marplatensis]CAB3713097.1 hypothetical protein LMG26219_06042 [Achromobacter marplatensis]
METIKLTFTGDPSHPGEKRQDLVIGEHTFPLGKPVDVPDTPAFRKLAANSHFNGGAVADDHDDAKPKTVAELKAALDGLDVPYPDGALKADLQALYDQATA